MKGFTFALAIFTFALVNASCESNPTDPSSRVPLTFSPAGGFQPLQATTAQVTFTAFSGPTNPTVAFITAGPDGNLWFSEECPPGHWCHNIGRITPTGEITEFPLPLIGYQGPNGSGGPIVLGPDGNLWFAHYFAGAIGKISPSTGVITEFLTPSGTYSNPAGITAGPDGNLWFTELSAWKIGKITPNGDFTEYPIPYHPYQYGPTGITTGADGNLWFTVPQANIIARSTPAGIITEFEVPTAGAYPLMVTAGPDGNVWFTEGLANQIGRITPAGVISEFPLPPGGAHPYAITPGPDGNLWFTDDVGVIGRITPAGMATEFSAPDPTGRPLGITAGPDGNLWFTDYTANKIIKVDVNQPPVADPGGPYAADEGSPVTIDGGGSSDPDGNVLTYDWNWGDGSSSMDAGATPSHTYADNGTYEACLTVTDPDGAADTGCTTASIANVAPTCGPITGLPTAPVQVGTSATAGIGFSDPGTLDTHMAAWDWDDGSTSSGTVIESDGSGTVGTDSHTYATAGIYAPGLTVTDSDGDICQQTFEYMVVYDPDGGFVTGGGWIDSPRGAYALEPQLTGKATFGFVAKYQKGASIPTGNTEFQFRAGDLRFQSDSYDWLIVTGSNYAKFKGLGTVNGQTCGTGDLFKFQLWAGDSDPDTFRIKIWCGEDELDGVLYDNGMDQEISGGSIVVHTSR